ncbi:MAG: HAD-IA family hydrolase [Candidatus Doudnabacteria bacterium]
MPYKYRAIIFDFDDTLVDSKGGVVYHQKVAAEKGWRVPSRGELEKYWGLGWEDFIAKLWPDVPFSDFRQAYIDYNQKEPRRYGKIPGVNKAIEKLKKENMILGVLSNRNVKSVRDILAQQGFFLDDFEIIQGEEELIFHKPDPRAFDNALTILGERGILACEIIYVGDTRFDVEASRGRKIKFIGVRSGLMDRQEFKALGILDQDIIKSVKDLPRWLKKYGRS